jgi:hypothetical protein
MNHEGAMRLIKLLGILGIATTAGLTLGATPHHMAGPAIGFTSGRWLINGHFVRRTRWSVNGLFTDT